MTRPIRHFAVLDSTNEEAKRLGLAGECSPVWLHADRQTHGRGRRARHWQSPVGNLAATGLYHWDGALNRSAQLGFAAALAVADTAARWVDAPQSIKIKWPNDVLLHNAKLAGILLESGVSPNGGHWIAIGIGINVQSAPKDLPYAATAFAEHLKPGVQIPAPEVVLPQLIESFEGWYKRFMAEGFAPLRLAWLARAHGLGQALRTSSGEEGIFEDLSVDGALVLRQKAGRSIEVSAGEVFFADQEG